MVLCCVLLLAPLDGTNMDKLAILKFARVALVELANLLALAIGLPVLRSAVLTLSLGGRGNAGGFARRRRRAIPLLLLFLLSIALG